MAALMIGIGMACFTGATAGIHIEFLHQLGATA
jgi:hypothetical protein